MHVCMYVHSLIRYALLIALTWKFVCDMHVCMHVCMYACMHVCALTFWYALLMTVTWKFVCDMHVCVHVCMYAVYVHSLSGMRY